MKQETANKTSLRKLLIFFCVIFLIAAKHRSDTVLVPIETKFSSIKKRQGTKSDQQKRYLSPEAVIKMVLKTSLRYQKTQAEEKAIPLLQAEAMGFLDWRFFAQASLNSTEQNTLNFFESPLERQHNTHFGVEKPFLTGTRLKWRYSLLHFDKDFTLEFKKISSSPAITFRQKVSLEIEQDLWRNVFGYEDRLKLRTAVAQAEAQQLQLLEAKEDLILQALKQFWIAYVSQVSLKLKKNIKQDYESLLKWTKKKKALGYIKPGEWEQIQAEWEKAKQDLILQKTEHENTILKLWDLLNYKPEGFIWFKPPKGLTPPPVFTSKGNQYCAPDDKQRLRSGQCPESLLAQKPRTVKLMTKLLFIAEQNLKVQKSTTWPELKLFGSYSIGGYEADFSSSFEGLKGRQNQGHSFGLKLVYPISSSSLRRKGIEFSEQAVQARRYELEISQKEFTFLQEQSKKNIKTLYQAVKSAQKIQRLRSQSYKKIRKAFVQGRLSVFELIKANHLAFIAEQEKSLLKAQYYQALSYIKALYDKLIPSSADLESTLQLD